MSTIFVSLTLSVIITLFITEPLDFFNVYAQGINNPENALSHIFGNISKAFTELQEYTVTQAKHS